MNTHDIDFYLRVFRNSLHAIYREIRHIGIPGDNDAKCIVPKLYYSQALKIEKNRYKLKSTVPYRNARAQTISAYYIEYLKLTELTLDQVIDIFETCNWVNKYGGEKWAAIARIVGIIGQQIDRDNLLELEKNYLILKGIRHNSGPLIPSKEQWENNYWIREKWPELLEDDSNHTRRS